MEWKEITDYVTRNYGNIIIVGLTTVAVATAIISMHKSKNKNIKQIKFGDTVGTIDKTVEDIYSKATIDQLKTKRDDENYELEAKVVEIYDVKDVGYSGIITDNTGKMPFLCDTDNYISIGETAMIPVLLNDSIKTGNTLKLYASVSEDEPLIANIVGIAGKYEDHEYKLNLEE